MFIRSFIFLAVGFWVWLAMGPGKRAQRVQPVRARVRPGHPGTGPRPGGDTW
jgi:hypothetical protein